MKKHDVFISYKSEDFATAQWVRTTLETNGIACWMAPADIPGGSDYAHEIPVAIAQCRIVVVILSEAAQQSIWIPKELSTAVSQKKIVMPFMLENCRLQDDFNFYFTNVQRYEAYENKSQAIQTMVKEIQAILSVPRKADSGPAEPLVRPAPPTSSHAKKKSTVLLIAGVAILCLLAVFIFAVLPTLQKRHNDGQATEKAGTADIQNVASSAASHEAPSEESGLNSAEESLVSKEPASGDAIGDSASASESPVPAEGDAETTPEDAAANTEHKKDFEPSGTASLESLNDMFHITLKISDDWSVKDFTAAKKLLRERVELFADGREYKIIENDDTVDLFMPTDALVNETISTALKFYLTRSVNLYLSNSADPGESFSPTASVVKDSQIAGLPVLEGSLIPVAREDLRSVTLHRGAILGVDASKYGIRDPEYQYIVITLNDAFVSKHAEKLSTWKNPVFVQDMEEFPQDYYPYFTFPSGDGKTFYVLNNDLGGKYSELVVYNLTHAPLPHSFHFQIDINYQASWEDPLDPEIVTGQLQRACNDFSDGTITLGLSGHISDALYAECEAALKKRLDALGIPYAFGFLPEGLNTTFVINLPPDRINEDIADLLGCFATGSFRSQNLLISNISPNLLHLSRLEDGKLLLDCSTLPEAVFQDLRAAAALDTEKKEEFIFFLDDYPLFRIDSLETFIEEKKIQIDSLCAVRNSTIVEEPLADELGWFIDFLTAVIETNPQMKELQMTTSQYNPGEDGTLPSGHQLFPSLYAGAKELAENIRKLYPGVPISCHNGNLEISVPVPVNESLSASIVDIPQKLFSAVNPENRHVLSLTVNLVNQETESQLAQIFFRKVYARISKGKLANEQTGGKSRYYYAGKLLDEKAESFRPQIQDAINASDFYQEHTNVQYSVIEGPESSTAYSTFFVLKSY